MTGSDSESESVRPARQDFVRFMQQHQAAIVADWEQQARQQQPAAAIPRPVLIDHIPQLLDCIADIAEQIQAGGSAQLPDDAAELHAITRLAIGFDLAEVVNEFVLLRGCILQRWAAETPGASGSGDGPWILNQAIDKAIQASVQHYTQAQHRALQALDRVSAAALESRSLDDFLKRLLQAVLATMPTVDSASVLLLEGDLLRERAGVGLEEESSGSFTLRLGEGFAGRVAAGKQPVQLNEQQIRAQSKSGSLRQRGLRSLYGIPLLHGEQLVGVVHVGSLSAREFSKQDQQLLQTMAGRATAAIIQHVLRSAGELRARQQTAIAELQALALTSGDLQQVMERAVELVKRVLETEVARLEEIQPDGILLLQAQSGGEPVLGAQRQLEAGSPEALVMQRMEPVLVQDYRSEQRVHYPEILRQGGILSSVTAPIKTPGKTPSGRPFGIFSTYSRQPRSFGVEDGMFLQAMSYVVSSTMLRQRTESALRLAAMVAKLGLFDWDLINGGISWSDRVREMFGLPEGVEVTEQLLAAHVHPEDRERVLALLQAARAPGSSGAYLAEYRILPSGGGTERWINATGQVLFNADGRPYRFLGIVTDVTDRKLADLERERLMQELERAVRVREDVLAIASHDLRSPLAAITMSASLLARRLPGGADNRLQRQVETIQRASSRIEHLISGLLDMAHIQVGQLSVDRRPCQVQALVAEAVEFQAPVATVKGVALEQEVCVAGVEICGDPVRLQQVFSNLLGNAIKFCSQGDVITLKARRLEDMVHFSIQDTGPGIALDELPHIFEPYWSARQHARQGTGLGLFIAKGIITAHGGKIWVDSQPGVGSVFHFTVPVARS